MLLYVHGIFLTWHLYCLVLKLYLTALFRIFSYVSSIMPFTPVVLAPLVGLTVDRLGGKLYVLLAAGLVTLLSYFILEVRSCVCIYICVCVCVCSAFREMLEKFVATFHPCSLH